MYVENVKMLRDHLVHLKEIEEEKLFYMASYFCNVNRRYTAIREPINKDKIENHSCKSAACLAGWALYLRNGYKVTKTQVNGEVDIYELAGDWLGLSHGQRTYWFMGDWIVDRDQSLENVTIDEAIEFLNNQITYHEALPVDSL